MAAPTELKDSLQKISALMGLLRSDLLELSQSRDSASRSPVVDHIHWIADQLDELGDGLSDDGRKPHRAAPAAKRSGAAKPNARAHSGSRHASQAHGATSHAASGRAPLSARRTAHPDTARPSPRRHAEPHPDERDVPPAADNPTQTTAAPAETPATPPLPDVPSMPGDDKLH